MVSSKSGKRADAVKLRERILKQKMAGTLPDAKIGKTTCGELLKGLLRHAEESLRPRRREFIDGWQKPTWSRSSGT
jgi:hypothetical protein